jgi:hypothetical protein
LIGWLAGVLEEAEHPAGDDAHEGIEAMTPARMIYNGLLTDRAPVFRVTLVEVGFVSAVRVETGERLHGFAPFRLLND